MTKFPVLPLAPSRNILIALSSGQGIQPWLMGLAEGHQKRRLRLGQSLPVYPGKRTISEPALTSH